MKQVDEAMAKVAMKIGYAKRSKVKRALKGMMVFHFYKKLVFAKCSVEWRFLK